MLRSSTLFSHFKDEVNALLPECVIHVDSSKPEAASPAWNEVGAMNIERLHTYLRQQHPEAGPRYWRSRGWGLLIWQPIYLAVIAAHKCQIILPLNKMRQHFPISGIPSGIFFSFCQLERAQADDCVRRMAEELMSGCREVYSWWSGSGLTRKNADRVVADCILSALLLVYPQQIEQVEASGDLWLASTGLRGAAGFIHYKSPMGESCLALHKKNCCFRYLCQGRGPCDVCPRQTMGERLKRLNQTST